MKKAPLRRKGKEVFLTLRIIVIGLTIIVSGGCREVPAPEESIPEMTPEIQENEVSAFQEDFQVMISDVSRELKKLASSADTATPRHTAGLAGLDVKLDSLSDNLEHMPATSNANYLGSRKNLEKELNEIVASIELVRLKAIVNQEDYMRHINFRLQEIDLELMDLERRIGETDSLSRVVYIGTLDMLKVRRLELRAEADEFQTLQRAAFEGRRSEYSEKLVALGEELRSATSDILRLSSGLWEIPEPDAPS